MTTQVQKFKVYEIVSAKVQREIQSEPLLKKDAEYIAEWLQNHLKREDKGLFIVKEVKI